MEKAKITKTYKDFPQEWIGYSDVACLTLVGYQENKGVVPQMLNFGGNGSYYDGSYYAYIVIGKNVEIGKHYTEVATYSNWLKVYDDDSMIREFVAEEIIVYRAGDYGCIVQLIGDEILDPSIKWN